MAVLASGTALSAVTTPDPYWWRLHFSELGTYDDFSGHTFNGTLVGAGLLIAVFALRVRADLRTLHRPHPRLPSAALIGLIASVGIHLALVGLIPITADRFLHDRAASGVMMSFLGILALAFVCRRHAPTAVKWTSGAVSLGLAAAIGAFLTGGINLAVLEVVGFVLIFLWIGVFTRCLHHRLRESRDAVSEPRAEPAESASPAEPQAATTVLHRH